MLRPSEAIAKAGVSAMATKEQPVAGFNLLRPLRRSIIHDTKSSGTRERQKKPALGLISDGDLVPKYLGIGQSKMNDERARKA